MKNIDPNTELYRIVAAKKAYLQEQKQAKPYAQMEQELPSLKPFKGPSLFNALKAKAATPQIIAEVKKASPSRGVIREDFSLAEINDAYQANVHVVAISVLTEKDYFQGSEDTLAFFAAHNTHHKPLLRKDFIFDPYQVLESKLLGAQAYLLIASLLDADELHELIAAGQKIGIEPLVEVHDREELELAQSTNARIIGVNCRDLKTFSLDPGVHDLLKELDNSYASVAESGIETAEYLNYITDFCDAALVGTNLMAAEDIGQAIDELVQP